MDIGSSEQRVTSITSQALLGAPSLLPAAPSPSRANQENINHGGKKPKQVGSMDPHLSTLSTSGDDEGGDPTSLPFLFPPFQGAQLQHKANNSIPFNSLVLLPLLPSHLGTCLQHPCCTRLPQELTHSDHRPFHVPPVLNGSSAHAGLPLCCCCFVLPGWEWDIGGNGWMGAAHWGGNHSPASPASSWLCTASAGEGMMGREKH